MPRPVFPKGVPLFGPLERLTTIVDGVLHLVLFLDQDGVDGLLGDGKINIQYFPRKRFRQ